MIKGELYEGVLTFGSHKGRKVLLKFIRDIGGSYQMEAVKTTLWNDEELEDWEVGRIMYFGYDSYIFTHFVEQLENV